MHGQQSGKQIVGRYCIMRTWVLRIGLAFLIVALLLATQGKATICGRAILAITADLNSTTTYDPCVLTKIITQFSATSSLISVSTAVLPTTNSLPHLVPHLAGLALLLIAHRPSLSLTPPTPPPRFIS